MNPMNWDWKAICKACVSGAVWYTLGMGFVYVLRILGAVLTLGYSERWLWVGRHVKAHGGFRTGVFGGLWVDVTANRLTYSGLLRRGDIPARSIAMVSSNRIPVLFKVRASDNGKGGFAFRSWVPTRDAANLREALPLTRAEVTA